MNKTIIAVCMGIFLVAGAVWAQDPAPAAPAAPAAPPKAGHLRGPGGPHPMLDMLRKADADKDGKATFEEMKAARPEITKERFDMMDRNKDGVLSAADFPSPAEAFKEADKDANGKVTFEELQAARPRMTKERFDMMDANKDGVLTLDEMRMGPRPGMGRGPGLGHRQGPPPAKPEQAPPAEPPKK
ncbi:MAG TPA: EF-hand domain-containing protein [Candidatus Hydrogenedentes bacterium]|nr:EF-hand domain-containing protein [Candidatus Hydrogenedentota bacterium]HOV75872.1 EF-hand domain-containing protein [Candidatus Hydrogenedentota bacterium]HPC15091.1 EF-hand domain-containing protein [Candidatus Hydrogenedentota bacterium]HRT19048.1 EF-hand domain-containing protein [Candidatus Hydrogenedentota bacterium]HRT63977.1 EF-hand domain-containing protein [Candidatus Hydrogenedentota bacterium]